MLRLWDVFTSGTGAEAAGASGMCVGTVSAAADSANSSATGDVHIDVSGCRLVAVE